MIISMHLSTHLYWMLHMRLSFPIEYFPLELQKVRHDLPYIYIMGLCGGY